MYLMRKTEAGEDVFHFFRVADLGFAVFARGALSLIRRPKY